MNHLNYTDLQQDSKAIDCVEYLNNLRICKRSPVDNPTSQIDSSHQTNKQNQIDQKIKDFVRKQKNNLYLMKCLEN